jgi:hypothetical protein
MALNAPILLFERPTDHAIAMEQRSDLAEQIAATIKNYVAHESALRPHIPINAMLIALDRQKSALQPATYNQARLLKPILAFLRIR